MLAAGLAPAEWVGLVLTGGSVMAGAWAIIRSTSIKTTLDVVILGNEELRKINDDLRHELAAEKLLRVEDKAQARAEIARLEGQLQVLTGHLGESIAAAVVRSLPKPTTTTTTTV
ncbi:MAG: hypothetical protein Q7V57_11310 [Actinomycetota bacterium]|nr:hypothetical protein [Actinomycetota bacterium]